MGFKIGGALGNTGSFSAFKVGFVYALPLSVGSVSTNVIKNTITVSFIPAANSTTTEYSLNDSAWSAITPGTILTAENGTYTLKLRGVNPVGDYGPVMETIFFVYVPPTFSYALQTTTTITDPQPSPICLGYAVGVSSDGVTVAAGTIGGGVRIFSRNNGLYSRTTIIEKANVESFARQSTLSGNGLTLFVGSSQNAIYVYKRTSATSSDWTQTATVTGSNTGIRAISTNYSGTRFMTDDDGTIKAYEHSGTSWSLVDVRPDTRAVHGSGRMSDDGSLYVVDVASGVRVYEFGKSSIWDVSLGATWPSARSASISGDGLTISASAANRGSYLFEAPVNTKNYVSSGGPLPRTNGANGMTDSLNHDGTLFLTTSDLTGARIFKKIDGVWTIQQTLNIPNERYGYHGSLSRDGSSFIVGADQATVSGVTAAGKVYVYYGTEVQEFV